MNASVKCKFADLKYEQLLSDKYFVETCFSKKYDSYSQKNKLKDWYLEIKLDCCESFAVTHIPEEIDCTP